MHHYFRNWLALIASVCLSMTSAAAAPQGPRSGALQTDSTPGQNLAATEADYTSQLERDPANTGLRLERAHVLAWQKKYDAARQDYQLVLQADPRNISALNGLGYALAWAGDYTGAEERFGQTLAIAPGQSDATKGLAYVALWRGDPQTAIERFQLLAQASPNDATIQLALGQAHYAAGNLTDAHKSFQRALALDPNNTAARDGLTAVRSRVGAHPGIGASSRPLAELSVWGGPSFIRSPGLPAQNDAGLRFAEAAVWPTNNVRLSFQYDNGLSLDNPSLVRAGKTIPAYFVGGLVNWKRNYLSRFEVGWRSLPGNVRQTIYRGEQVFFLPRSYSLKVGGWIGPREDKLTEWLTHTGVGIPLGERLRVEPTLFYSRSGLPGEREWRLWVPVEYSFANRWSVGGGIAGGQMFVGPTSTSHSVWDGSLRVSAPLGRRTRGHVMFRHEAVSGGNSLSTLSFGLSFEIPGR